MDEQLTEEQTQQSIEDTLTAQRAVWVDEITKLNEGMKSMPKLDELLNSVYITRQKAVDYYYAMNGIILKHTKEYKKLYNDMFNAIKVNGYNGIRFNTDQAITRQIETDLQDRKEVVDMLTNHNNFMKETIQTIDNIIYGVNQKVKIHALLNGINTI
jgi:hypothetical protein